MNIALLVTKLQRPVLAQKQVRRPHLTQELHGGFVAGRRLTLVSAPAGFGKTNLVAEWLSQAGVARPDLACVDSAWLAIDQYDDDPNQFWQYVLAALQTVVPEIGADAQQLTAIAPLPPPPTLFTSLLNDVAGLPDPLILVLDDYHHITSRVIHAGMDFLLEHAPSQLHIVLITRADPPLLIARLRVREQLTEIRQEALQFDSNETATFFNKTMGLDLSAKHVGALALRAEGWITGLQLTALSLRGRTDVGDFIARMARGHHYILDYLTTEVLQQQPAEVRSFLLQTSILSRLCGPLCNAVTGRNDSHSILERLYRRNLFIVALGSEHGWFRYHHLLVELLANLLRQSATPDEIRTLHSRAAAWYQAQGDWESAIAHRIEAADWPGASELVAKAYYPLLAQGRIATWQRWLAHLPASIVQTDLSLQVFEGWALFLNGRLREAEMLLASARKSLLTLPSTAENQRLRGELATYLATAAFLREDSAQIKAMAEEALAFLPQDQLAARARAVGALGLGLSLNGDTRRAMNLYDEAVELARSAGNPFLLAHALEVVADGQFHTGQLRAAADTCRQIIALGSSARATPLPFVGNGEIKLAGIYAEWQELEKAEEHLKNGIRLNEQGGIGYNSLQNLCVRIRLCQAMDDMDGALKALRQAENVFRGSKSRIMAVQLSACAVQFWLNAGDVAMAARWAKNCPPNGEPIVIDKLPLIGREMQLIALARVYLAQSRTGEALAVCNQICDQVETSGRFARLIEISLIQALAYHAQGQTDAALAPLTKCLSLAAPEGYIRLFMDTGIELASLLQIACTHAMVSQRTADYAGELLVTLREMTAVRDPSHALSDQMIDPLTARELEVLQLIDAGYSNRQIAAALTVTLNTVKKHSSHIYEKLGVQGRTQAIAKARQLDLLAPRPHRSE